MAGNVWPAALRVAGHTFIRVIREMRGCFFMMRNDPLDALHSMGPLPRICKKLPGFFYNGLRLVMVHPVAGFCHAQQSMIGDRENASFFAGIASPTVLSSEQKNRASDLTPDFLSILLIKTMGRDRAHEIIELPRESSIRVPIGTE